MKRNDINLLHEKTLAELQEQLVELNQQWAKAKLELKVNKLSDLRSPSKLRDDIARVKTIMREKELLAAVEEYVQQIKQGQAAAPAEAEGSQEA